MQRPWKKGAALVIQKELRHDFDFFKQLQDPKNGKML